MPRSRRRSARPHRGRVTRRRAAGRPTCSAHQARQHADRGNRPLGLAAAARHTGACGDRGGAGRRRRHRAHEWTRGRGQQTHDARHRSIRRRGRFGTGHGCAPNSQSERAATRQRVLTRRSNGVSQRNSHLARWLLRPASRSPRRRRRRLLRRATVGSAEAKVLAGRASMSEQRMRLERRRTGRAPASDSFRGGGRCVGARECGSQGRRHGRRRRISSARGKGLGSSVSAGGCYRVESATPP